MIRAGDLKDLAIVEKHNGTIREGEPTYARDEDWEPFIEKLWVQYRDVSGGETIRGRQMHADATGMAKTWLTPETKTITEKMRLVIDGRKLNILSVMDMDGDRQTLTIQVAKQA